MYDFSQKYIFRMTHLNNIPHILQHGITHKNSANKNPNYIAIGDSTIIGTRNSTKNLINGRSLGEYIPFYFGYRTPMLYVIQKGFNSVQVTSAENIVYCVSSIAKIIDSQIDYIFTDGHAINNFTTQYLSNQIKNIDTLLDYNAINDPFWIDENDLDKKRRKEAELLLERDLPPKYILGYICSNESTKSALIGFGIPENKIVVKPNYYF